MAAFDSDVDVTVEFGFGSGPLTASPTWTDVSTKVKAGSWARGRSSVQADFSAGSGRLLLDNTDGDFYPWNTASPHSPDVTVGVPVRIRAVHNTVTYPLFYGYVTRWPNPFPTNTEELAQVEMVETFTRLASKRISGSYSAQTSDARVAAILDDAGWPSGLRNLESGVTNVAAIAVAGSAVLGLLRAATEAEQGQLFQAADGDLTFLSRVAASNASSDATFGPDGAELTYTNISAPHDDDFLYNEAFVTGSADGEQFAEDATSRTNHGPSSFETTNSQIVGASGALNVAEWIVAKYKDIVPRVTGLTIDPAGDPANLWPEVLGRELRDVITVEATYPGSITQLVQEVAIESIAHSFEVGGVWSVSYGCHPLSDLEQEEFYTVGVDNLDGDTVLA